MKIELVNQQDDFTCGVACAAMVAGVSFAVAKACLPLDLQDSHGLAPIELDDLLSCLNADLNASRNIRQNYLDSITYPSSGSVNNHYAPSTLLEVVEQAPMPLG